MKKLFNAIAFDKNKNLKENVEKTFKNKENQEVTVHSTTEDFVIMGAVDTVYTDIQNPWGDARTCIKLAGETTMDPVYNIPVQEDAIYVNFDSSSGQYPNNRAEEAAKLKIKVGSVVLIKGKRDTQVNSDGEAFTTYTGTRVQYAGSAKPIEMRSHDIWLIPGTSVLKNDHILVYVKGWDAASKSEYTVKVKAYPSDGVFSDELKAAFEKQPNVNGEMKNPQAVFVVPSSEYKLVYKNGKPVDGEMKFKEYEIIPKTTSPVVA